MLDILLKRIGVIPLPPPPCAGWRWRKPFGTFIQVNIGVLLRKGFAPYAGIPAACDSLRRALPSSALHLLQALTYRPLQQRAPLCERLGWHITPSLHFAIHIAANRWWNVNPKRNLV